VTFVTWSRPWRRGHRGGEYRRDLRGQPLTTFRADGKGLTEKKAFWIETEKDSFLPAFQRAV